MKKIYIIAMTALLMGACKENETLNENSVLKTKVTA